MEKKSSMHPDKWALFLRDDGLNFDLLWGELHSKGEDGLSNWKLPDGALVITSPETDWRSEICNDSILRKFLGIARPESFHVYRSHVGDINAWSWGSLPGKRLDEGLISRLVYGRYAEKELDHLQEDAGSMDMKKMLIYAGLAIAAIALIWFVVVPQFTKSSQKEPAAAAGITATAHIDYGVDL